MTTPAIVFQGLKARVASLRAELTHVEGEAKQKLETAIAELEALIHKLEHA